LYTEKKGKKGEEGGDRRLLYPLCSIPEEGKKEELKVDLSTSEGEEGKKRREGEEETRNLSRLARKGKKKKGCAMTGR